MTVHLLTVRHRHGEEHWICATREIAQKRLDAFVKFWWDEELATEMPNNREDRIREYFEEMAERGSHSESYSIEEHRLLTRVQEDVVPQ